MTWQAPWAWLGLAAVVLPVLIHLLGQGHARRLPFPTLRFLGPTRPLPTRRTRVHDLLLLVVRVAILVAAVAALAQPLLLTAHRKSALNESLVRAIIVDTSASMRRVTAGAAPAIAVALRQSQQFADSAATAVVLRTATPSREIPGAITWLGQHAGRGELVVVSDFQVGSLDAAALAVVPPDIGVRLVPIAIAPNATPLVTHARVGSEDVAARIALSSDRTDVEWTASPGRADADDIVLLAGAGGAAAAEAARHAAWAIGVPLPVDSGRRIVVVYPGYPGRATLLQHARPLRSAWMADVVARIGVDATLLTAASNVAASAPDDTAHTVAVVRTRVGFPPILAAADRDQGRDRLLLFSRAEAGSLTSAALIAAAHRALSSASPVAELDPATLSDSLIAAWQQPATARSAPGPDADASDGGWLWVAALLLLGAEAMLRRGRPQPGIREVAHDAAG